MINSIFAIHNTIAKIVLRPMDVFSQVGQLWYYISDIPLNLCFDVGTVSSDGNPA